MLRRFSMVVVLLAAGLVGGALTLAAGRGRTPTPLAPVAVPATRPARFVVMLDPGHGGTNTGAAGVVEGVYEKRVTLAISRQVAAILDAEPGIEVRMTRDDDRYLTLRERVRRANHEDADVFVSVHCNASPTRGQRGYETWILTPEAQSVDARALRAGDGPLRGDLPAELAAVLDDAERGAAAPWSVALAVRMQGRLAEAWGPEHSRGVRQGSQDVLMGPVMPAVLVEVGFLDHPIEGAELLTRETRARLAQAIAAAILDYRDLRAADPR